MRPLIGFGAWLDRLVGVDGLSEGARQRLVSERLQALRRRTPALIAGAAVMSAILVAAAAPTIAFPQVALWSVLNLSLLGYGMLVWLRNRDSGGPKPIERGRLTRATLLCVASGMLWGIAPTLMMATGDLAAKSVMVIAVSGVLFASGSSLAALPMAALSFTVPVAIGLLVALARFGDPIETAVLGGVVLLCVFALGAIGLRSARSFVKRVRLELVLREQQDVISLLLKEFEEHGSDWLWSFDRDGVIRSASDRFAASSGHEKNELEGRASSRSCARPLAKARPPSAKSRSASPCVRRSAICRSAWCATAKSAGGG